METGSRKPSQGRASASLFPRASSFQTEETVRRKGREHLGAHTTVPALQEDLSQSRPLHLGGGAEGRGTGGSSGQKVCRVCREAKTGPGSYQAMLNRLKSWAREGRGQSGRQKTVESRSRKGRGEERIFVPAKPYPSPPRTTISNANGKPPPPSSPGPSPSTSIFLSPPPVGHCNPAKRNLPCTPAPFRLLTLVSHY